MIEKRPLGTTGIEVGRIGISSSFGAGADVFHEAFERGCNYFTWGTFIRGRSAPFRSFVRQMVKSGKREHLVIGLLSYSHSKLLGDRFLHSALRQLNTDYLDGLILGYFPKRPPQRLLDWAWNAKEKGLVRAIGMTTHNRDIVAQLAGEGVLDYFHFRYNAVHRGAETDIFAKLSAPRPGLVSFTATSWGQLLNRKKVPAHLELPTASDCYRFVLARPEIDVCMMGVRNLAMFRENVDTVEKGALPEEDLARIRAVGDHLYGRPRA